jgi:hypothetical protein
MKKKILWVTLGITLLLAVYGWGNRLFTLCAFRVLGIEVLDLGYDFYNYLDATIRVKTDSATHQITFGAIKPKSFIKRGFLIKGINGYTLLSYSCQDNSWRKDYCNEIGRYVATRGFSLNIIIKEKSVFSHFFGIEEFNIPYIVKNISTIEAQLMSIPDDRYSYYRSERGDEVYFKRVHREPGILDKLMKEVESNDTLFVFQNPNCNPERLRRSE